MSSTANMMRCAPSVFAGARGSASRLDGEWWMGHHLLWREREAA